MAEKKDAAPVAEEAAEAPKPKKKKTLLIALIALLVLGGGGAGWYFTKGKKPADPKAAAAQKQEDDSKPPVYSRLDVFTVNLQKSETDTEDTYLQTEIQLKVADEKVAETVKLRSPEIRNALLLLLSSKTKGDLASVQGKQKLSDEIVTQVNKIVGAKDAKSGVLGVYFTSFVIQ